MTCSTVAICRGEMRKPVPETRLSQVSTGNAAWSLAAGSRVFHEAMPLLRKLAVQVITLASPARDVGQKRKPRSELRIGELTDDRAVHEHEVDPHERAPAQRRAQESPFLEPTRPRPQDHRAGC